METAGNQRQDDGGHLDHDNNGSKLGGVCEDLQGPTKDGYKGDCQKSIFE